ncbi:hypothetical protein EDB82DRAFT_541497 [Fusarium venenatum]|uniref:uncharacterized protein n=1 Tax=Fusarium venenatum TaxID=56646 RepID=UPI001D5127C3|nr:hypothetical protein EDB82DRAFT_541497 [Fusarium venenatum]
MARKSKNKRAVSPRQQIIERIKKSEGSEGFPENQANRSTGNQRENTLSDLHDDGSVLVSLAVDETRMRSTCSKWTDLTELGIGHKRFQVEDIDFGEEKAKDALRAVIDIIHRKNDGRHYTDADPRLLFYSILIHESLGTPQSIHYPEDGERDLIFPRYFPFFSANRIKRVVVDLTEQAKYLYRVQEWLLLAAVAYKLKLEPVLGLIRDNLALFLEAGQKDMPNELRHDSIKDYEWTLIQELRLINDEMLDQRLVCVERTFHALRLLSHQVDYMDNSILPTREEFDVYQEGLSQKILKGKPWPLFASSHTTYQGSVVDLIRKIRSIEEHLVEKAKPDMSPGELERDCNQLTHLYDHLRNLRKELFL